MKTAALIEARKIAKSFGHRVALAGVDLSINRGEAALLLGPNGAGKSTLCKILALLSRPSSGTLFFRGEAVAGDARKDYKSVLGYLSHQILLYGHLSAEENLRFFASLYGVRDGEKKSRELLERFDIYRDRDRLVFSFSRGMQQRLSLARLLLSDPEVLLLDEPFTGLDPDGARKLVDSLNSLKSEKRAILMITHELDESVGIAEKVFILDKGRMVFEGDAPPAGKLKDLYFNVTDGGAG